MNKCAWCGGFIGSPAFACYASLQSKQNLEGQEGTFVWVIPKGGAKSIPALVATKDSPAKAQGVDLLMACCSEECASELREALKPSFDLHEVVEHKVIGFGEPISPRHGGN